MALPSNLVGLGPERDAILRKIRGVSIDSDIANAPRVRRETIHGPIQRSTVAPLAPRMVTRCKAKDPKGMNATERAYAQRLASRQAAGEVVWFGFERITLRIGADLRYTPDFPVILADGQMEFHEVKTTWVNRKKGTRRVGWTEDGRAKFLAAASAFPFFRFFAAVFDPETKAFTVTEAGT